MSNNVYEPHSLMITSGEFWRCDHGNTGYGPSMLWVGCTYCVDPEATPKAAKDAQAPAAQGVSSLTDKIKDGLAEIVRQHGEVYGRIVPAAAWLLAWLAENESGVSEPVEQQPAAYRADWPNWRQYHDETDPLPATWDCEVPTITPLYTRAGGDAVRALTDKQIAQMQDERWHLLKCSNDESTAYSCGVFDAERAHGIGGSGAGSAT